MATKNEKKVHSSRKDPKETKEPAMESIKDDLKTKGICFVIMPFGGYFDEYYSEIYHPAIEKTGLKPVRTDNLFRSGSVVKDIWEFTKESKVILAELTTQNPNVFYELGLAHAIQKPVILITQVIEDVPFDLRGLRVIEYDTKRAKWDIKLGTKIERAIKETLKSPLNRVLPTFLDVKDIEKKEVTETEIRLLEIEKDLRYMKNNLLNQLKYSKRYVQDRISEPDDDKIRTLLYEIYVKGEENRIKGTLDDIKEEFKCLSVSHLGIETGIFKIEIETIYEIDKKELFQIISNNGFTYTSQENEYIPFLTLRKYIKQGYK